LVGRESLECEMLPNPNYPIKLLYRNSTTPVDICISLRAYAIAAIFRMLFGNDIWWNIAFRWQCGNRRYVGDSSYTLDVGSLPSNSSTLYKSLQTVGHSAGKTILMLE